MKNQMQIGPAVKADRDQILAFLNQSIPEQIYLTSMVPDGPLAGRFFGRNAEAASDWAVSQNAAGKNVYFSPNYVKDGHEGAVKKQDVLVARLISIDVDPPKDGSGWDKMAAIKALTHAEVRPSIIVDSGNGLQAHYRVDESAPLNTCEEISRAAIAHFGGDHGTHNCNRVMRVPGTINWPDRRKRARGNEPSMATVVRIDDGSVHSLDELITAFPPINSAPMVNRDIEIGDYELITADDLYLPTSSHLRRMIENPTNSDRSSDVFAFTCQALREGYSKETVAGILHNQLNAISAHIFDQADPERAIVRVIAAAVSEQGAKSSPSTAFNSDALPSNPISNVATLSDMLARFVFVKEGSQVADLLNPSSITQMKDFRNATAASKTRVNTGEGSSKVVATATAWLEDKQRMSTDTVTFRPGKDRFTEDPKGRPAFNTWTPYDRNFPPAGWETAAQPFVDHVKWLWGRAAEQFLNWLAHIEQLPGVLPHFGWLHIAPNQGLGRNWISNVLQKVWHQGHVATSFDLEAALQGKFNGELGGKILAVVDEICAGGLKEARKSAQVLKQLVTEQTRLINPKYAHQYTEFNACRWLIFSNSPQALPLEDGDRRFWVEECKEAAKDRAYYKRLYDLLEDPDFITSVAHFLATRDLSTFDSGAMPPLNEAKDNLLERCRSDTENEFRDILREWPDRLITSVEIAENVSTGPMSGRALQHAATRAKLEKLGSYRARDEIGRKIKVTVYAIENAPDLAGSSSTELRRLVENASTQSGNPNARRN